MVASANPRTGERFGRRWHHGRCAAPLDGVARWRQHGGIGFRVVRDRSLNRLQPAGVAAWRFGRRLHALGADRATVPRWRAMIVLFGPVAVLAGLAIERPRRHARRATTVAVPSPRIASAPKVVENIA